MAQKQPVTVVVDGVNINASHFGAMKREDAIARMKKDNIGEGNLPEEFFGKAYDASVKALDVAEKKTEKVEDAAAKEAAKVATDAHKAANT